LLALRRVLDLVLANGARLAQPGEFTKRAFLNGRIDLSQAEAVLEIIRAKTDTALKIGMEQLKGGLSGKVNQWRSALLGALSRLEANIDFPEEGLAAPELRNIREGLDRINRQMQEAAANARFGRLLREGVHVVICGRPNVGKSSLLNALLKTERSIVTALPGTTRDTVEEVISIKGIPIRIVDTAGILEPRGLIERHAVRRAKKQIELADLVILLFDGSRRLSKSDKALLQKLKKKTVLAVINKIDIAQKIERGRLSRHFRQLVEVSAKKLRNIGLLEDAIAETVYSGRVIPQEALFVANSRHAQAIRQAQKLIAEALDSVDNNLSLELVAQGLRDSLIFLDELLGRRFNEELLDKVFSDFCIGK
jgi:tRNA modification GTPase